MRSLLENRKAVVGLSILGVFAVVAVIGPWLVGDAGEFVAVPLAPPSLSHWFGTTGQGQDVLAPDHRRRAQHAAAGIRRGVSGGGHRRAGRDHGRLFRRLGRRGAEPAHQSILAHAGSAAGGGHRGVSAVGAGDHRPRAGRDRLGLERARHPRPGAVAAPERLRLGGGGGRREPPAHHPVRDPPQHDVAARFVVHRVGDLRHRRPGRPGIPGAGRRRRGDLGDEPVLGQQRRRVCRRDRGGRSCRRGPPSRWSGSPWRWSTTRSTSSETRAWRRSGRS